MDIVREGAMNRSTNSTTMNDTSSRSHAVLWIFLEKWFIEKMNKSNAFGNEQLVKKRHHWKSLVTVVDLAGSERISKSGSEGLWLQEAKNINKSISALGNVINALSKGKRKSYVPYWDSKLTRLLTDCLGGNSNTTIVACVSPSNHHYDESYSTILFASWAMNVRTNTYLNENIDYKVHGSTGDVRIVNQDIVETNMQLRSEAEEMKNEINELWKQIQRSNTPIHDWSQNLNDLTPSWSVDWSWQTMHTHQQSANTLGQESSPFTKSFVSDRSWIEQTHGTATENQQLIDKFTAVISHLQK